MVILNVSPDGIKSVEPHTAVGTLVITDQEQVLSDVRSAFCTHVNLFADSESAQEFVNKDSRRYVVAIEQFNEASRRHYAAIWGKP